MCIRDSTSATHNDTTDLYEIAANGSFNLSTLQAPTTTDNVKLRTGTFDINQDNKEWDSLEIYDGAIIRVLAGNDLYLTAFDNEGTWDQTGAYTGEIHVGDFTPFDSGDIIDDTEFVDTGFHDITHYLEMDL